MVGIQGKEALIQQGAMPPQRKLILDAIEHAINKMLPDVLLRDKVSIDGNALKVGSRRFPVKGRIFVIGTGKASGKMAEAIERLLKIEGGVVSVPRGTAKNYGCRKIELIEAAHPFPDAGSELAASRMIALSAEVTEKDLVVCLISGGGSSLLALPEEGITMQEKIAIVKKVMKAGADIFELNSLRKSLSAVKGGKLAMHFRKAKLVNIILSDVLGNPVSTIASGPTVLDTYTYAAAKEVLEKYGFWDAEQDYCKVIERGIMVGKLPLNMEKVRPSISNFIIGDNDLAVKAAASYLRNKGVEVKQYFGISGDARDVGKKFAIMLNGGISFVAGGETTVTVKGDGVGGRNQELALDAAMHLKKGTLASAGTDGIDGISEADGAIVDHGTAAKARAAGLNIAAHLNNNASNSFFRKLGDGEIITGPTGTNVCDLIIGLA